jgi:hypothetical protein
LQEHHMPPSFLGDGQAKRLIQSGRPCYTLRQCPGCVWFPGWLTDEAQLRIATDAFTRFPEPPATTNHTAQYGALCGLWQAAVSEQLLQAAAAPVTDCTKAPDASKDATSPWHWVDSDHTHRDKQGAFKPGVVSAERLLRRLRWASLGPQYGAAHMHACHASCHGICDSMQPARGAVPGDCGCEAVAIRHLCAKPRISGIAAV